MNVNIHQSAMHPHDDVLSTLQLPAQVPAQAPAQAPAQQAQHERAAAPLAVPAPSAAVNGAAAPVNPFADPTALGLFGLAIGCASLLPLAFGVKAAFTPDAIRLTAWFCLLFGAGCQFLAGLMSFANKNGIGGTLLTTFSFNWVMNYLTLSDLSQGHLPNESVVLAVDVTFFVIFVVMTVAFGFFSKLLFAFLADIVVLYGLRIARAVLHAPSLGLPIGLVTIALMLISLYIAFSLVLANAAGRVILPIGAPLWKPTVTPGAAAPSH